MADTEIASPAEAWIIRPDELHLVDNTQIGGRQIAEGRWRNSLVMVKVLSKQAEPNALHVRGELWTSLHHPNVLQMFGVSPVDADPLYVVTQFQPDGNVNRFLEQHPQADRAKIVCDTAAGMQYLHSRGVVHGSLKPPNILVRVDGRACVSDYGMIEVQTSGGSGHRYFSPEAWKGTISRPSDVFAWAMCALEIFTSKAPWGILSEKQIFRLLVRQDSRPDRPDEDFGLTDHMWGIMEKCWQRDSRQRPAFDAIIQLLQSNIRISAEFRGKLPRFAAGTDRNTDGGESMGSVNSRAVSIQSSIPPAYEAFSPHPGSAPPTVSQFGVVSSIMPPNRTPLEAPSGSQYTYSGSEAARYQDCVDDRGPTLKFNDKVGLAPSMSRRASSSGGSSRSGTSNWTSGSGGSSGSAPRLRNISEDRILEGSRSLPATPLPVPYSKMHPAVEAVYEKHSALIAGGIRSEYTESTAVTSSNASVESLCAEAAKSSSSVGTATAPNATLLAGALLSEVKEGRKREVVDPLLSKIKKMGLKSHKDAERLVTAGTIPTLILLLKTRAVDGIGLDSVLMALGILTHDPITANIIYRTGTASTLLEIINAAQSEDLVALAVWCLARIGRNTEVASGLLKQNIGKLLVTKGLRSGDWRTARIAAWCLGVLIRTDAIAESLADGGLVAALCEHMRRCSESPNAGPEDYSAAIFAVARISRSIKIAKALAKGGCAHILAHCLNTTEDPCVLLWSARAVGCLMRPNSSDMAKLLLDAGVARGLARLPSMLPPEEVEPLASFAFAVQRFSCAQWGGSTRSQLVDAGVVDSLLAALRTSADEPYPQVHIELAYGIALLSDVGGGAIRKEIVNAGGIEILKQIAASAGMPAVAKACNLAATSIIGNLWSRNAASAKAALAHEWSGGCPDYVPECPVPMTDV